MERNASMPCINSEMINRWNDLEIAFFAFDKARHPQEKRKNKIAQDD
jgi:hypothetical protein